MGRGEYRMEPFDNSTDNQSESPKKRSLGLWGESPLAEAPPPTRKRGSGAVRPAKPVAQAKPPRPPGAMGFLVQYLYVGSLLSLAAMVFFILGFGWPMLQDHIDSLPGIEMVNDYRPDLGSQLFSTDEMLIADFYKEEKRKRLARRDELPQMLVDALIATEDQQFYEHHGVNPIRILKAAYTNATTGRRQGGSTITQQIVKAMFVGDEISYQRKIREALYSLKIEQELSKDEILSIYFNQVSFGHNKAGIWSAAEEFFGKTPMDLNLAECATLVGMLKAVSAYSPVMNPDRSKLRRGVVLRAMLDCGFITEEQFKEASEAELELRSKSAEGPQRVNRFPYWRAYFEEVLFKSRNALGGVTPTNDKISHLDEDQIYRGGLKIRTTLDLQMQQWGEDSLREALIQVEKERRKHRPGWGLKNEDKPKFASTIFANATLLGEITGFVEPHWLTVKLVDVEKQPVVAVPHPGSNDWRAQFGVLSPPYYVQLKAREREESERPEQDLVDRGLVSREAMRFRLLDSHLDQHTQGSFVCLEVGTGRVLTWVGGFDWDEEPTGRQRIRCIEGQQPGSAFKPIIIARAFEKGYTPASKISNEPYSTWDSGSRTYWTPSNYTDDVGGYFSIRDVLIKSLNIPTVRIFENLVGGAYEYDPVTQQPTLGIARRMGIKSVIPKDLSVSLGTAEVSPLEMATAYSVLANEGVLVEPYTIESVQSRDGQMAYVHLPDGNPQALDPVISFLTTDILTGVLRKPSGTGYTRAKDFPYPIAGKTGTTNLYFDAWFVGYSKNLVAAIWIGHDRRTTLGYKMAGGATALPPWLDFMKKAIPYHLEEHKGWTAEKVKSASGDALSPTHPLAFATPGKGIERMEVCTFSGNKPNAFCKTVWIWGKAGEGPRAVCRDCGIKYTDAPVIPTSGEAPPEAVARPRPIQKRLPPVIPPPPFGEEPDYSSPPPPRERVYDVPPPAYPPVEGEVVPAVPRPVRRERGLF